MLIRWHLVEADSQSSYQYCQAQPQLNSTQSQLKLRLRLTLFPADPPTHPPRTVVSKTSSVLLQYNFKTTL